MSVEQAENKEPYSCSSCIPVLRWVQSPFLLWWKTLVRGGCEGKPCGCEMLY